LVQALLHECAYLILWSASVARRKYSRAPALAALPRDLSQGGQRIPGIAPIAHFLVQRQRLPRKSLGVI
jgi:hypothetical protein